VPAGGKNGLGGLKKFQWARAPLSPTSRAYAEACCLAHLQTFVAFSKSEFAFLVIPIK